MLPEEFVIQSTPTLKMWEVKSMAAVARVAGPLIASSKFYSAGATRALKTSSERVIRVVATMIPFLRLKWWRDCIYYEFQYVLADGTGEVHPPKDGNRNEIEIEEPLYTEVRQQILQDVNLLFEQGAPLGPEFLRQLGRLDEASVVQADLQNFSSATAANSLPPLNQPALLEDPKKPKRRRRSTVASYEIAAIVDERAGSRTMEKSYLVEWSGYEASWEVWRAAGNVGEAVQSWEPWSSVQRTEALQVWEAADLD